MSARLLLAVALRRALERHHHRGLGLRRPLVCCKAHVPAALVAAAARQRVQREYLRRRRADGAGPRARLAALNAALLLAAGVPWK